MFNRVLVPLDGSPLAEAALRHGTYLARALDAELKLVRVASPPNIALMAEPNAPYLPPDIYEDLFETGVAEARSYLHDVTSTLQGVRAVTSTVVRGQPGDEIIAIVHELPNTLVVMSSHGRTGIGRAVLGSVAEHVVRHSECPVVLIRSGMPTPPEVSGESPVDRIVVALDGSPECETVIAPVEGLATALGASVVLVHVAHSKVPEQVAADQLERASQRLANAGISTEQRKLAGSPAEAIAKLDNLTPRSLIAMATHARIGLDRLISGSVAGDVFRAAPCPVLLVRAASPK